MSWIVVIRPGPPDVRPRSFRRARIQVGFGHAGLTVAVTAAGDSFQIYDENRLLLTEVPRMTSKPITRFKARKPERSRTAARDRHVPLASTVARRPETMEF
jgi:hypothetical protein